MPSEHAKYSPSSSDKWANCPGYMALLEKTIALFGPEPTNEAAEEGTKLHAIAEKVLKSRNPTRALRELKDLDIDAKAALEHYVDVVEGYLDDLHDAGKNPTMCIEERVVSPDGTVFGTVDCIIWYDGGAIIVDYKTGKRNRVDPDSLQLKIYGYLVAMYTDMHWDEKITLVIDQPRYYEKGVPLVREKEYIVGELLDEVGVLLESTKEHMCESCEEFIPGDHCKYCFAKPLCPAKIKVINNMMEAKDLDTEEKLKFILDNKSEIYDTIKRATGLAISGLERGSVDPTRLGYGLAKSYGNRRWNYDKGDEALAALLRRHGVDKDKVWVKKVISPAQAEKLVDSKEWLDKYLVKEDKGFKLVPLADADESLIGTVAKELASFDSVEESEHKSAKVMAVEEEEF